MMEDIRQWLTIDNADSYGANNTGADEFGREVFGDPEEGKERNQDEDVDNFWLLVDDDNFLETGMLVQTGGELTSWLVVLEERSCH